MKRGIAILFAALGLSMAVPSVAGASGVRHGAAAPVTTFIVWPGKTLPPPLVLPPGVLYPPIFTFVFK